jgi:hypothetical protein
MLAVRVERNSEWMKQRHYIGLFGQRGGVRRGTHIKGAMR